MSSYSKLLLTNSSQSSFKNCRKRYWYEYHLGIRRVVDAKALRMGSAYHAGLHAFRTTGSVDEAAQAARAYYDRLPPAEAERVAADRDFECETVVALVTGYCWRWSTAAPLKVLASEQSFRVPLVNPETGRPSTRWCLAGVFDGLVQIEDGRMAILEHKLQSDDISPESDYWRRLQIDNQITLYVYAARQMGYTVDTVLYDVARKPTIRATQVPIVDEDGRKIVVDANGNRVRNAPKKAKRTCESCQGLGIVPGVGEVLECHCTYGDWRQTADTSLGYTLKSRAMTTEEWIDKLLADISDRPEQYYARMEIPRLDAEIEEFQRELWDIQLTISDAMKNDRWYRTVGRDNCSFCSYFSLCTAKFDPKTFLLPADFAYVVDRHPELSGD